MPHRPALRALAVPAALVLGLGACSTATPSPSPVVTPAVATAPATPVPGPTGTPRPLAEVYAEIRSQVEAIRGLQPTSAVEPVVIDADQLAKNLTKEFDSTHTEAALKDAEDELITLGLLPKGTSLRAITLAFQGGQVAGYYSPEQNELFVVSRTAAVGPADESTYAHEFTHQLQDQHFDLDKLGIDVSDQSDRSLARLALVEGDATSAQTTWMTDNLDSTEMGEVFAAGLDPEALKAFNDAPPYLQQTSLFPYQSGLAFVMRLIADGGYDKVNAAFTDPPDSTEQILHPEKYLTREAPVEVKLPAGIAKKLGAGWTEVGQDTMGEMLIALWLKIGGVAAVDANRAAAGWGGDRLALYRGPNGETAVGIVTSWDTAADAQEFAAAAGTAVRKIDPKGFVTSDGLRTVLIAIGGDEARLLEALGGGSPGG